LIFSSSSSFSLSATVGWVLLDFALASADLRFRWHPRIVIALHALPLCGAAPTFLCRRKEK
jgi:hypothetical protein